VSSFIAARLRLLGHLRQQSLRLPPRDRVASLWDLGRRLLDEHLQRRDGRVPANALQRQRGQPAKLLVLVAQGSDQLTDGFRRALPAEGQQPAETLRAVALGRQGDQDRLGRRFG